MRSWTALIRNLFEMGQQRTQHWLAHNFEAIGQHGTADIRRDYLGGRRAEVPVARIQPRRRIAAFQPWLARVFRRMLR